MNTVKPPTTLQEYLLHQFRSWQPPPPTVEGTTTHDVTLAFNIEPFSFLHGHVIYRVEKKEKIPPWLVVYSGGKTKKTIDNLAPSHPHRFRVKVILKSSAVATLAEAAIEHFGDETTVYKNMKEVNELENRQTNLFEVNEADSVNTICSDKKPLSSKIFEEKLEKRCSDVMTVTCLQSHEVTESRYSQERWTSTESDGTSVVCFCMAVSCGYLRQVQQMLEERPELVSIINCNNGLTPLASALKKGDVCMVSLLLAANADLEQRSWGGRTPLMLAVLWGQVAVAELLLDRGADLRSRDLNQLRVEHYAVDSCRTEMVELVLDRGGDLHVTDNNNWTPLFRAVCQGASTSMIELLVGRGSILHLKDRRQVSLVAAARLLNDRHGRRRDSVLRLVDTQHQHERVVANFNRLTKKMSTVHTLLALK